MKNQKRILGSILNIDLGNGYHSYARILKNAEYAFYDIKTNIDIEVDEIISKPILFILSVYDDVITNGRWEIVGEKPLESSFDALPMNYIQDPIDPNKFQIYDPNTGEMFDAQKEDCIGLGEAAVWDAEHVEERIRKYYGF
jgi:hypothetical protein